MAAAASQSSNAAKDERIADLVAELAACREESQSVSASFEQRVLALTGEKTQLLLQLEEQERESVGVGGVGAAGALLERQLAATKLELDAARVAVEAGRVREEEAEEARAAVAQDRAEKVRQLEERLASAERVRR